MVYSTVLTQRNFKRSFIERMGVLLVKQRISVSEPPFGGQGVWVTEALIRLNRPLLNGLVTLGLNIRLKGRVYTPLDRLLDRGMVLL